MKKILFLFIIATQLILPFNPVSAGNWWRVYFTEPSRTSSLRKNSNPEKALVATINSAKKYFYGAFYDISSNAIVKALVKAKKRGVDIRLVTEDSNYNKRAITKIIASGIPVITDRRHGLMHNKFAVIDDMYLWTGSYNTTKNGALKNNNNAIKIYSVEISKIYLDEFNEMFNKRIFGNKSESGIFADMRKKYYVKIDDTDINAYFSPEDNVERIILKRIKKAKKTIHFMAYSFTSKNISNAMISRHKKGVRVYGIFERRGARSRYSEYVKMKLEGLNVRLDRNRYAMHHKVIIIDGARLITGSYNFSKSANSRNDENILVIDNREICRKYLSEFKRLY